jgi:hypothetical protein
MTLGSIVALAVIVGIILTTRGNSGGAESERAVVDRYVAAINAQSAADMEHLIVPGNVATNEIANALKTPRPVEVLNVEIRKDMGTDAAFIKLTATSQGKPISQALTLTKIDGRWYLGLGRNPEPMDSSGTQSS